MTISDQTRGGHNVYFPRMHGEAVSPGLKDMWASITVPDNKAMRIELIRAKLRTNDEYERRDKIVNGRNEAEMKRLQEQKKAEKKSNRTINSPIQVDGIIGAEDGDIKELFE